MNWKLKAWPVWTGSATDLLFVTDRLLPAVTAVVALATLLVVSPSATPPLLATSAECVSVDPPPAPITPVTVTPALPPLAMAPRLQFSVAPDSEQPPGVPLSAKPGGTL